MTIDPSVQWFVAQTHPHAEAKAADHLGRQAFSVYVPRYLKRRRHARRVDLVAAPLFPRYLFVGVSAEMQRWRAIQSTIGITHLICNGDAPALVHGGIIEALKRRENPDGFIVLDQRPHFRSGDKVRVLDGAFADALGLFEGITDNERVTILLDLLGRKVRVSLDVESVAAA